MAVSVQFFWDANRSATVNCIAQVWASKKWAGSLSRVGMKWSDFRGDPRPLVVGTVAIATTRFPHDCRENTMAGWKSDSSKGGNGYNELIFEDKKSSENIRMHAEKDHNVTVRNSETWTIGEAFMPPKGSPSRSATLKNGDDQLSIQMGDRNVTIPMGSQSTTAMISITHTVGMTTVTLTPATKTVESPVINHTAETIINDTAGATINLTAPIINLNGMVLINGMVPVLIPV